MVIGRLCNRILRLLGGGGGGIEGRRKVFRPFFFFCLMPFLLFHLSFVVSLGILIPGFICRIGDSPFASIPFTSLISPTQGMKCREKFKR